MSRTLQVVLGILVLATRLMVEKKLLKKSNGNGRFLASQWATHRAVLVVWCGCNG
jgi:hypothetical protein